VPAETPIHRQKHWFLNINPAPQRNSKRKTRNQKPETVGRNSARRAV